MIKPDELKEMEIRVKGHSQYEGDGYWTMRGVTHGIVAYICLPKGHPDIGKDYDTIVDEDGCGPDVNGGLTYAEGRLFGWDYLHAENDMDVSQHIKNALEYFKAREAIQL